MTRQLRNGRPISSNSNALFGTPSTLFKKRASTANLIDLDEHSHAIKRGGDRLRGVKSALVWLRAQPHISLRRVCTSTRVATRLSKESVACTVPRARRSNNGRRGSGMKRVRGA